MTTTFELQDGTTINTDDKKQYRIGLSINNDFKNLFKKHCKNLKPSSTYIETFYLLTPNEILQHVKRYDGKLVYIVEM